MLEIKLTYRRGKPISAVGLQAPLPFVLHLGGADGLDLLADVGLGKLDHCDPVGVKSAAVVADLVCAPLQRRKPSGDEGGDEVIGLQLALLDELQDVVVVPLQLSPRISWVILPVELLDWGTCLVIRQVDQIYPRVLILHVELASEPLLA